MKWSRGFPLLVRAMALTKNQLLVAGIPDIGKKRTGMLAHSNPDDVASSLEGKHGAFLYAVGAEDGEIATELRLNDIPTFDGMSAAYNNIYLSLRNGQVVCLGKSQ